MLTVHDSVGAGGGVRFKKAPGFKSWDIKTFNSFGVRKRAHEESVLGKSPLLQALSLSLTIFLGHVHGLPYNAGPTNGVQQDRPGFKRANGHESVAFGTLGHSSSPHCRNQAQSQLCAYPPF